MGDLGSPRVALFFSRVVLDWQGDCQGFLSEQDDEGVDSMIHFCTCTRRTASFLEENRKQGAASSCKICGQKPSAYERGALSGSMLSSVGLELTRVIDPELSWTVPKSSKRATRRARGSLTASNRTTLVAGSLKGSVDLIDKDPKRVEDMSVSESEKLGVSILGRRFSDGIENIPIKKRKFPLVRSPSPPPQTPPHPEESECLLKGLSASNQKKPMMSLYAEDQSPTILTSVSTVLDIQSENFKVDVDRKHNSTEINENHGDDADFSGISILAAAACSGNIDCSSANLEDPASYNSLDAGEGSSRVVQNTDPSSMPEELGANHLPDLSDLDKRTDLNICTVTRLDKNFSAGTSKDHQLDLKSRKCPMISIISEKSVDIMKELPAKENETLQRVETSSSRDDRSHWDLNIVMDAWESPCDEPFADAKSHATFGIVEDGMQKEKVTDFEHGQVKMELGDTKDHIKLSVQHNVDGTVVIDGQDSCKELCSTMQETPPFPSDDLVADVVANKNEITFHSLPKIHELNEGEHKHHLEACTGLDSITCSLEKTPCETDNSPYVTTDVSEETKPFHSQELIRFNAGFTTVPAVDCELGPASHHTRVVTEENTVFDSVSFDGKRKGEIISSNSVSGDTSGDCITHLSETQRAGHAIVAAGTEGGRGAASVVDSDKPFSYQLTSDDQGDKASRSRCPSPGGDCDHLANNTVSKDDIYACSVVSPGNHSGDQCMTDGKACEASCLVSPQVEKLVACCRTDSDKDSCQMDDPLALDHCTERTSGLPVNGNLSEIIAVEGNAVDQSKFGGRSSSLLDASVHKSFNSDELPTAITFSQVDNAVAVINEEVGKTSMVCGEDVNDTEMTAHVHFNPKDSLQNANEIPRMVGTSAVLDSSISLKVCESNEDYHVYGSGEVVLEDSFNSDYDSDDISQKDNATTVEMVSLYQADDDSQYEDGEFREPIIRIWEEDEGEEREAEHVDYGSDNMDTDAFEPSADYGVIDHDECKNETLSEISHVCQEGKLDGEKNEREPDCKPSLRGSLETNVSPVEPGERRAMKVVRKVSRRDLGRKDDIEKLKMDVQVVSELNAGGDKVLVDEEISSRELCHSEILRTKSTGWDQLPDVCRSSRDAVTDFRGSSVVKNRVSRLDSSEADGSLRRVFKSTSYRELSSVRKDKAYLDASRSNNLDERDAYVAKYIGRGGSSVHMRGRGRAGNHWLESSGGHWDRNRHNSPGFHGPGDHVLTGPKNAAAAAAAKLESSGFFVAPDGTLVRAGGGTPDRVRRRSANSPSRNLHRSLTGRGSSTDRDGTLSFVMPLGHRHGREMSPSRSTGGTRGGSGRYALRVCGTGQRERYNGASYNDDIGSSLPIQRPLTRRQSSFSPIPRRPHRSRSHTKSRSRSRSSSPHMWTSPRGRSSSGINRVPDLRRQLSRSPNFHMETRIRRMRSPPRRQGFAEHMIGFVPAPRNNDSPSHVSRWIDDRRGDVPDHFREHDFKRTSISERSSPGRGFSRNPRLGLMDSPIHSGRFPEFFGGVGGRPRHDASDDDRRKDGERYGMARHYDDDGIGRRFRYNVEDGFCEHQPRTKNASESRGRGSPRNFSRGIESRLGSGPKRDGEERSHFRNDRDGKRNANFNPVGVRECDEDAAAKRGRPT